MRWRADVQARDHEETAMTTHDEIRRDGAGLWTQLLMTAVTAALVGGAALWHVRPSTDVAIPVTSATGHSIDQDLTSRDGLAEFYRDQSRVAAVEPDVRVTTMGGLAELIREHERLALPVNDDRRRPPSVAE
jgi:hypothetical protein